MKTKQLILGIGLAWAAQAAAVDQPDMAPEPISPSNPGESEVPVTIGTGSGLDIISSGGSLKKIHMMNNGFCLYLSAGARFATVARCSNGSDQLWDVSKIDSTFYAIKNSTLGTCSHFEGDDEQQPIAMQRCDKNAIEQNWYVKRSHGNFYMLENRNAEGLCLALGDATDGAQAVVKYCSSSDDSQAWKFF